MWNQSSPNVLDYYEQNIVPDNIKLWYQVWSNLFDNKMNHYYYRLEPISLRYVLNQIMDLLEIHNLKNTDLGKLKKILIQKLNYVLQIDFISKELYKSEINKLYKLINESSKEKPKEEEIIYLCKYILQKFKIGWQFQKIIQKIKELLFKQDNCSIRELQILSQLLIIELVEKGINMHNVEKLLSNIFSNNYHELLDTHHSGYYFSTKIKYDLNENSTFEDRVNFIEKLFKAPTFKCKLIYLIYGATAENLKNYQYENITFVDRLEIEGEDVDNNNSKLWVFDFQEKDLEHKPFLRAIIEQDGMDFFEMYDITRGKLFKIIEFLKYKHSYSERVKLKMSGAWAVLDENNKILHQLPSINDVTIRYRERYEKFPLLDMIDSDVKFMKKQGLKYGLNQSILESNKIFIILEWIRKAETNYQHLENYFTSLWFALENLVRTKNQSIIESITNYIPAFYANNFLDDVTDDIHNVQSMSVALQRIKIKDYELGKQCGLISDDGKHYNWNPIDYGYNLYKLLPFIEDVYVYNRTKEVSQLYKDKAHLKKTILTIYDRVYYEFNVMYKIRNDIVHAGGAKVKFLGYYCIRLKQTLDLILDRVVWDLNHFPDKKINEILGSQQFIYELYLDKILTKEKLDAFDFR